MKIGVRDLQERTSDILRLFREEGEIVDITYRAAVVARLVPLEESGRELPLADFWDNWDSLSAEVSALWPRGVAALDAIREDRR